MKELSTQEDQAKKHISLEDVSVFSSKNAPDTYNIKRVSLPKNAPIKDMCKFNMLCNELKQLYVALTRPRSRIIIFDENTKKRESICDYWNKLGLVEFITRDQLEKHTKSPSESKEVASFKALIESTTPSAWKLQGLRMFRHKYYEQAYKCFEKSGHQDLKLRAEAYMIADRASQELKKIANERAYLSEGVQKYANIKPSDKKKFISKLKDEEKAWYSQFEKAARIFDSIGLTKQAGQCFFSAGMYYEALKAYEKIGFNREAGEACYMLKDYERAGDFYRAGGDFIKAIECYEKCNAFEKVMQVIRESRQIPSKDREHYAKKCATLAIKQMMERIDGKFKEEVKTKLAQQIEDAFRERSGSEESQENEAEEEGYGKQIDFPEVKSELTESKREFSEPSYVEVSETGHKDIYELTLDGSSILGSSHNFVSPSKQLTQQSRRISELSFDTTPRNESFEHLSQYSLEDEFLKSREGNALDNLTSLRKKKSLSFSDFSIMERRYAPEEDEYNIIQTRPNITIQDDLLQRLVEYTTLPIELSGHDVAISMTDDGKIDLTNIDPSHLNLILEFLDQEGFYKLCILICNRYHLNDKIGQYLVNLAYNYSYFLKEDVRVSFEKLSSHSRIVQQDRAYIASTAINHIFELINPEYLKLKHKGEKMYEGNSLGYECYTQLISLGLWKKCLFIMDYDNSLALASAFASFKNYKIIYFMSTNQDCTTVPKFVPVDFEFLPFKEPSTKEEAKLALIAMEAVAWDILDKMPLYLSKRYHIHIDPKSELNMLQVPENFPSYFKFNEALWKYLIQKKPEQSQVLEASYKEALTVIDDVLESKTQPTQLSEIQLYDALTFILSSFILYKENPIKEHINNYLGLETLLDLLVIFKKLLVYLEKFSRANRFEEIILRALLAPFR